jgi:hypothetical protein
MNPIKANNAPIAKRDPYGHFDSAVATGGGMVRVAGWAADPDNHSAALRVHIYVDGKGRLSIATGVYRPDVARKLHIGANQGFAASFGVSKGRHLVCTYAINIGLGLGNTTLGCKTVTVR